MTPLGANGQGMAGSGGTSSVADSAGSGTLVLTVGGDASTGGRPGTVPHPTALPAGFTKVEAGGYQLGTEIDANAPDVSGAGGGAIREPCETTIHAVLRDFSLSHPDFEHYQGDDRGIVNDTIGADRKPVFSGSATTVTSKTTFDQWYRGAEGVNHVFAFDIFFQPIDGVTSFRSDAFFPLDGKGFGNEGKPHNFAFTTEIHTSFKYSGGEHFNFQGDDDVWVFLNNRLAVDLGGVHEAETALLDVDAFASEACLVKGNVYPFDLFQAERHSVRSNFHADTNLDFVDCGDVVPDAPK